MDGVLADFVSFTTKHLGKPFTDEDWLKLPKDMFYQLPPMRDAKVLWEFIGRQDPEPFILTAVPRKSDTRGAISERAADDKKRWMKKQRIKAKTKIKLKIRIKKKLQPKKNLNKKEDNFPFKYYNLK